MDYTRGALLPYVPRRIARMWMREGAFPSSRGSYGAQEDPAHLVDDLLEIQGLEVCKSRFAGSAITDPQRIRDLFHATDDQSIKDAVLKFEHAPLDLLIEDAELHAENPAIHQRPLFTELDHTRALQLDPWLHEVIAGSAVLSDNLWRNTLRRGDPQGVLTALKSVGGHHSLVAALAHLPAHSVIKHAEVTVRTQIFRTVIERVEKFRRCDVPQCDACDREQRLKPKKWGAEEDSRYEYLAPRVEGPLRAFVMHLVGSPDPQHEDFIQEAPEPLATELKYMVRCGTSRPVNHVSEQDPNGELARAAMGLWEASAKVLEELADSPTLSAVDYKLTLGEEMGANIPEGRFLAHAPDSFYDALAHLVAKVSNLDQGDGGEDMTINWPDQVSRRVVDLLRSGEYGYVNWKTLTHIDKHLVRMAATTLSGSNQSAEQLEDFRREVWPVAPGLRPTLLDSGLEFLLTEDGFLFDPEEWLPHLIQSRCRVRDLFKAPDTLMRVFQLLSVEEAGHLFAVLSRKTEFTLAQIRGLYQLGKLPIGTSILDRNAPPICQILTAEFGEDAEDKWTVFADLLDEEWIGSFTELVTTVKAACE